MVVLGLTTWVREGTCRGGSWLDCVGRRRDPSWWVLARPHQQEEWSHYSGWLIAVGDAMMSGAITVRVRRLWCTSSCNTPSHP